jgi:AcrR family transcriptional regulator
VLSGLADVRDITTTGNGGKRSPRRRDFARTRASLLDAAAEVFARKGYERASLDEIAELAGFSRGAVHHHFSCKEDLFLAVIAKRDEEHLSGPKADLEAGRALDARVSAARWRVEHADPAAEVALRLELRSHALRSAALRERLVAVDQAAITATAAELERAAADRGLVWRFPAERVAELLHAASHVAAERSVLTGGSQEEQMADYIQLIYDGALEAATTKED